MPCGSFHQTTSTSLGAEAKDLRASLTKKEAQAETLAAELKEMQQFSFHPNINEAAVSALVDMSNHKPIHELVAEVQRERSEALQRLRMLKESDPELTYKPKVSEASERLAQRRRRREGTAQEVDISPRLTQHCGIRSCHQTNLFCDVCCGPLQSIRWCHQI